MKKIITVLYLSVCIGFAQNADEKQVKSVYSTSLTNGQSYAWLDHLSNEIGGRLSGSKNAAKAVQYTKAELEKLGLDKVWLQEVMVPKWERGDAEEGYILVNGSKMEVPICALGGSVATKAGGIEAEIIEVKGIEDLKALGTAKIKGKIVFYNRPMQADLISTFQAYGGCVDQRYAGAKEALKFGAVGVVVRSMNLRLDDYPHTGSMGYEDVAVEDRIPAAAISTNGAELLSKQLQKDPTTKFGFSMFCKQYNDVKSHNVIGQITGSEFPNEIIIVGGHLDSWDLGDGSHDDGAGVVQSMEVLLSLIHI